MNDNATPAVDGRILVYDGHCYVCTGWVRFFERHPVEPAFRLVPMQTPSGRELLRRHGIDPDDPSTFLVLDGDKAYTASDAVIHIVTAAGGAARLFQCARIVPRPWRDALYDALARNRYRWFGRRATCYLPVRPS
jgi:predicted DCC family thiol-disulfide oxidoreductase YuxK